MKRTKKWLSERKWRLISALRLTIDSRLRETKKAEIRKIMLQLK